VSGLVGRRLGRYEVLSLLGTGGMGEVYRARDTELERDVAVKVLPDAASGDPAWLERFRREARALSRLSHPNILEIFDAGSDDGIRYVVTELLEGRTLRDHLEHGRLPIRRAVAIADAISRGLGAAHAQGVVHRDVKPENVLLTSDGRVKVLDFGIASLHEPESAAINVTEAQTVTNAGALLGTIGYMAPEQVRGETADARSDVFAVGCVLYEMLTGRRAFERATPAATLAAIMHEEPEPPGALVPDLPSSLARVLMRCLEKEPGERFQSAADVAFALRAAEGSRGHKTMDRPTTSWQRARRLAAPIVLGAIAVVATGLAWRHFEQVSSRLPEQKHLALLPFTSAAQATDDELFAAGLREVVANHLRLLEEETKGALWVASTREARQRGLRTAQQLSDTFGTDLLVGGRFRRRGDSAELRLEVTRAPGGAALRSTVLEIRPGNISTLQEGSLLSLAELLGIPAGDPVRARLRTQSTNVVDAFEDYVRGLGAASRAADAPGLEAAVDLLSASVEKDPLFASSRAALAEIQLRRYEATGDSPLLETACSEAQRAASEANAPEDAFLVLAEALAAAKRPNDALQTLEEAAKRFPASGEISLRLGIAELAAGDTQEAEEALQRAAYLRPGDWFSHYYLGMLKWGRGRTDAAANELRRVVEYAPRYYGGWANLGSLYFFLERTDDARAMFERSLELEPNSTALNNLGTMDLQEGRFADAIDRFEASVKLDPGSYVTWGNLGHAYHLGPKPRKAPAAYRKAIELAEKDRLSSPDDPQILSDLAGYYAMLGDAATARPLLEKAMKCTPIDATIEATIGETWEDLGERREALEWIRKALEHGVPNSYFERRPLLRDLLADARYGAMVNAVSATH